MLILPDLESRSPTRFMTQWIRSAIKHPGALTRKAKKAHMSPMAYAASHAHNKGTTGKQARLALTLRRLARRRKH